MEGSVGCSPRPAQDSPGPDLQNFVTQCGFQETRLSSPKQNCIQLIIGTGDFGHASSSSPNPVFQDPPPNCWDFAALDPFLDFVKMAIATGKLVPDPLVPVQIQPSRTVAEMARKRYLEGGV